MTEVWNTDWLSSYFFSGLSSVKGRVLQYRDWPSLDDLNGWPMGQPIRFVEQDYSPKAFEAQYEPRIYLKKEVQTRLKNWHDFFNALIWFLFPKIKQTLNQRQYEALLVRQSAGETPGKSTRTPAENMMTHFDECGMIVFSDQRELLEALKTHQWKSLFWDNREFTNRHMEFVLFGHATYEMGLKPFIGMTTKALLLEVPTSCLNSARTRQHEQIDMAVSLLLANLLEQGVVPCLQPIPLLGIPGWSALGEQASFYDDVEYFRPQKNVGQLNFSDKIFRVKDVLR